MFLEASVYEVRKVPVQERRDRYGLLVLVMRKWPQGIRRSLIHMWIKDAGPSVELLTSLREGHLSAQEFEQYYEIELRGQRHCTVKSYVKLSDESDERVVVEQMYANPPIEHLRFLERLHGKVTLLCWEPEPPCHRYFLLQWLREQTGDSHALETCFTHSNENQDSSERATETSGLMKMCNEDPQNRICKAASIQYEDGGALC